MYRCILSYLRYSIRLYRVDSQGELAMEALRSVVKKVNENSSLLKRMNKTLKKSEKDLDVDGVGD